MKKNEKSHQAAKDYLRIEKAIGFLSQQGAGHPSLDTLARALHLSPFHLQRLFHRWAGITPKQFLRYLSLQHAKTLLAASKNILEASLDAGLSGPGRLHDLFVTLEAVTPGEYKKKGEGITVTYGVHATPFGTCLIALTPRGICHLSFLTKQNTQQAIQELSKIWENAKWIKNQKTTRAVVERLLNHRSKQPISIFLKGTNFQIKVWEALLKIPSGSVISYEDLAGAIRQPTAARAVSRAVASNPVAYLIPCHRVIHKNGVVDGYRWKTERKKAMLVWESSPIKRG